MAVRFKDIVDPNDYPLKGKKLKIEELLDQLILILSYQVCDSNYKKNKSGKYVKIQFQYDLDETSNSDLYVVFTGSDVLLQQLQKYGSKLPFECKISRNNNYYTLV
jgi:hypothetical protein